MLRYMKRVKGAILSTHEVVDEETNVVVAYVYKNKNSYILNEFCPKLGTYVEVYRAYALFLVEEKVKALYLNKQLSESIIGKHVPSDKIVSMILKLREGQRVL